MIDLEPVMKELRISRGSAQNYLIAALETSVAFIVAADIGTEQVWRTVRKAAQRKRIECHSLSVGVKHFAEWGVAEWSNICIGGTSWMAKPKVFIGSSTAALAAARAVKSELSALADAFVWDEDVFGLSHGTLESLVNALDRFDFAVLIFTPDDPLIHEGQPTFKPRDNVLIEFGLFTGALGRNRTFAMRPFHQSLRIPTDLAGVMVARLEPSTSNQSEGVSHNYDVKNGCKTIASEIRKAGRRPDLLAELGVLYRLINAFVYPHYQVPAVNKSSSKYRFQEKFEVVDQVIEFLGELLGDYVYPQLNPSQLETMRIYFGYYLGDGIAGSPHADAPRACVDTDISGKEFAGEFIIGLANPSPLTDEPNWRIGRAIEGFSGDVPHSLCAKVFESGQFDGFNDLGRRALGMPNYETPGELSVFSFRLSGVQKKAQEE
jgi:predicted nucleotide-binding protein